MKFCNLIKIRLQMNVIVIPSRGLNIPYLQRRGIRFQERPDKEYIEAELPPGWRCEYDGHYWRYLIDDGNLVVVSCYEIVSSRVMECYSIMGPRKVDSWWKVW